MAEQVNQRIEDMINELEQMRRTNLYNDDEIKEISRKRKEFEYHIQRRVKQKEDYVQYITFELALLEDIASRRKMAKLTEKRQDIEFAIAKRLNRVFKQFIYRYQNDIEINFEYIKFCQSVSFVPAISGIIGQMLQVHGDKPKMWLLASRWESEEQNNLGAARGFLLKGIQRHPDSEVLYIELFKIEILELLFNSESDEDKEKQIKRTDIVWRNGVKNIDNVEFLFKLFDLCLKHEVQGEIRDNIKQEIWSRNDKKEVWVYIASKELEGCHWEEIDEFVEEENFSAVLNNYIAVYEEALQKFPDQKLCTKYIHNLLGVDDSICTEMQKIRGVKHAWMYGHESGLLTDDMYDFGIQMLKLENEMSKEEMMKLLEDATNKNSQVSCVWQQKMLLCKPDEKKMLAVVQEAAKVLRKDNAICLYNLLIDNVESADTINNLFKKFQSCENAVLLSVKPKLLQKMYDYNGIKAARRLYEDLIKTPPTQLEVIQNMISYELSQADLNVKNIRKCFECAVNNHGSKNIGIWMDYIKFECEKGNPINASTIYYRAIKMLDKELVDKFIKEHTLSKLK